MTGWYRVWLATMGWHRLWLLPSDTHHILLSNILHLLRPVWSEEQGSKPGTVQSCHFRIREGFQIITKLFNGGLVLWLSVVTFLIFVRNWNTNGEVFGEERDGRPRKTSWWPETRVVVNWDTISKFRAVTSKEICWIQMLMTPDWPFLVSMVSLSNLFIYIFFHLVQFRYLYTF